MVYVVYVVEVLVINQYSVLVVRRWYTGNVEVQSDEDIYL